MCNVCAASLLTESSLVQDTGTWTVLVQALIPSKFDFAGLCWCNPATSLSRISHQNPSNSWVESHGTGRPGKITYLCTTSRTTFRLEVAIFKGFFFFLYIDWGKKCWSCYSLKILKSCTELRSIFHWSVLLPRGSATTGHCRCLHYSWNITTSEVCQRYLSFPDASSDWWLYRYLL